MKSVIALSALAVAYVSGQEAQIGGERPERAIDITRSFNQILGDFEPEDFIFDFRLVPVESMGIGGLVQPLSLGNAPVLALGDVAITRLLHYQQNMGCDTVAFVSKLNSADPGVQTATSSFFNLPIEQVAGSLDVSMERAEELRDGLPLNIVRANKDQGQCLKKCGL
eukprot:Awhi_evm1s12503